jgi:excisionase family DNA binding protein
MAELRPLQVRVPPPVTPRPEIAPKVAPRVVSISEAAVLLGLRPSTIRAWIGRRKISSVHLGRRVMIPIEAIEVALSRGLVPAREDR